MQELVSLVYIKCEAAILVLRVAGQCPVKCPEEIVTHSR
jgi:hypothetical protein